MESDKNTVGSEFTKQWPSITRLDKSRNLAEYSSQDKVCLVSEKFDGSNIAITCRGVVASRRVVLLSQPTQEEILKTKFSKVPLAKVSGMFPKVEELENHMRKMLPGFEIEDVIVYGEIIPNSSLEKFKSYKSRGIVGGDIFLFGAGVSFVGDIVQDDLDDIVKVLRLNGFTAMGQEDNKPLMVSLFMNVALRNLLLLCGFEELVEQKEISFTELAKIYTNQLVRGEIEGVIINFGEEVVKWKGATEEQHQHMKEIEDAKTLVDTETYESWKAIAAASKIFEEKENSMKSNPKPKSPVEALLHTAYKSALTKMMTLEEHLESGGKIEDYMKELRKEMMNDRPENQKEGPTYEKKLPSFIFNQLKEYLGDKEGNGMVVKAMGVQMKEWMNKKKNPN